MRTAKQRYKRAGAHAWHKQTWTQAHIHDAMQVTGFIDTQEDSHTGKHEQISRQHGSALHSCDI